ncbi:MAG TPA: DUF3099 domain-containing protein [Propionibacteriaceae bacterium]
MKTGSHGARFDVMGGPSGAVITDARSGTSKEMSQRIRRYTITMAFRTACFLSMIVVHGWFRWVLLAIAVFLPYLAVLLANQANTKTKGPRERDVVEMSDAPQLTTGHNDIISGQLADEDEDEQPRDYRDRVA